MVSPQAQKAFKLLKLLWILEREVRSLQQLLNGHKGVKRRRKRQRKRRQDKPVEIKMEVLDEDSDL